MKRFITYQKERFPIIQNGILISIFTYCAVSFSHWLRGASNPIDGIQFAAIAFITFTFFFLVRIIDEFKDYEEDCKNRPHLPVQRGVVKLKELGILGAVLFGLQLSVLMIFLKPLWWIYMLVWGYFIIMSKEFFVKEWLTKNQIFYVGSHMVIVPLVDLLASSSDWLLNTGEAPKHLWILLLISYANGLVLEIGRKIKAPENEESNSYTGKLGISKSIGLLQLFLIITLIIGFVAVYFAQFHWVIVTPLLLMATIVLISSTSFKKKPSVKGSKKVEIVTGLWTLFLYLSLGLGGLITNWIGQ
ncbi:MAG: UbiA family prenyltransferase [Flavobacteriales bacterium]|nr:UbiA family prenyltransferase [Flavobacteriales bacterium]